MGSPWLALGLLLAAGPGWASSPSLDAPTPQERQLALQALAEQPLVIAQHREAIGALVLGDPDPGVRAEAAATLAYRGHDRDSLPVLAAALHRETEPQVQQRLLATLAHFSDPRGLTAMVAWWLTRPANDPMLSTAQGALGGHNPCQVLTALVTLGHVNPPRVQTLKVAPLAGDCPVATVAPPWLGAPLSTLANHSSEPPSDSP